MNAVTNGVVPGVQPFGAVYDPLTNSIQLSISSGSFTLDFQDQDIFNREITEEESDDDVELFECELLESWAVTSFLVGKHWRPSQLQLTSRLLRHSFQ